MPKLVWDKIEERTYETGVDHGVLYTQKNDGSYDPGVVWNGLTSVSRTPEGAESNKQYADNMAYLDLVSAEELKITINAFTYPDEFEECDGLKTVNGVSLGQQERRRFGLAYRTKKGTATDSNAGYKIRLVYGLRAQPSEIESATVNDSPEAVEFSWECSALKRTVEGYEPLADLTIDSTRVSPANMKTLEDLLYGTDNTEPELPDPERVLEIVGAGAVTPGGDDTNP